MDEEGCFDVCVSEPELVDIDCFELWLKGHNLDIAARLHAQEMGNVLCRHGHQTTALEDDPEVMRLVRASLADHFRVFDLLESPYMYNPLSFLGHPFIQLSVPERLLMVELYYAFDPDVARELVWRKPSVKRIGKDLEEIKDLTGVSLRSCRRQHDSWRRVYTILEEQRGFQCHVAIAVEQSFLLSPALACQYTVCIFLAFHKFVLAAPSCHHQQEQQEQQQQQQAPATQAPSSLMPPSKPSLTDSLSSSQSLHHPQQPPPPPSLQHSNRTHALSFDDLHFMSLAVLVYWVPEFSRTKHVPITTSINTVCAGSTAGIEKTAQQEHQQELSAPQHEASGSRGFASLSHRLESVSIGNVGVHRGKPDGLSSSLSAAVAVAKEGEGGTVAEVVRSLLEVADLMVIEDEKWAEGERNEETGELKRCGMGNSIEDRNRPGQRASYSSNTTTEQRQQAPALAPTPSSCAFASCWTRPGEGARRLLQSRLRNTFGMELEKVLLVSLRELSRFFNDTTVLEQYQGQVTAYLLNLAPKEDRGPATTTTTKTTTTTTTVAAAAREGRIADTLVGNRARILVVERRFRAILRPLSALGWGLSLQKELKDFFEDVLVKVTHPLRDLGLSRRDLCHLFLALINSFYSIPILNEKSKSIPQKRIKQYAVAWARFLSGVLLCILHTYPKWCLPSPTNNMTSSMPKASER